MNNYINNLFVICCSNHKELIGKTYCHGDPVFAAGSEHRNLLLERRQGVLKLLLSDQILTRFNIPLCALPYNKNLQYGPDFGGKVPANYLPAYQRYQGRLYREVNKRYWHDIKNNVVILSGLYGLLLPEEQIQLYSLDLTDSQQVSELWKNDELLTACLISFIKARHFERVIVIIGDTNYSTLINWDRVSKEVPVLHVSGEQNIVGPALLPSLGSFLKLYASRKIRDFNAIVEKEWVQTRYEKIRFTKEDPFRCLESFPSRLLSDAIRFNQENQITKVDESQYKKMQDILQRIPRSKRVIHMTAESIRGAMELPPKVLPKYIKQIDVIIRNVSLSALDMEVIRNNQDKRVYRCRIDGKYRMHLAMEGKVITILAVGPHRLQGIG